MKHALLFLLTFTGSVILVFVALASAEKSRLGALHSQFTKEKLSGSRESSRRNPVFHTAAIAFPGPLTELLSPDPPEELNTIPESAPQPASDSAETEEGPGLEKKTNSESESESQTDAEIELEPEAETELKPNAAEPKPEPEPVSEPEPVPEPEPEPEPASEPEPAFRLVLPTGNKSLYDDPPDFYMHTNRWIDGVNTKPWEGGKYGFVRNPLSTRIGKVYTRLHEGIDIRPLYRDDRGVPLDDVRAISDGTVVYANPSASASNYGKYVVVRHDWPDGCFYSLYAHLASVEAEKDTPVRAGDTLGRLGYTGAGIDRERAHLHLELTMMLSERFDTDYIPGSGHGNYNGINLAGIDVAGFFYEYRNNPQITVSDFLKKEEAHFRVVAPLNKRPGILDRYPWLKSDQVEDEAGVKHWEYTFNCSGVPLSIAPVSAASAKGPSVSWVKPVNTNHSYLTAGRLSGSGNTARLSSRGRRYFTLISESF